MKRRYQLRIAPGMVAHSDSLRQIVRWMWMAWIGRARLWWQSRRYR